MTLKVHPWGRLLELECAEGSAIPYLGYVEVNLQIPGIKGYNEDILLLVIPTTTYSQEGPSLGQVENHRQGDGNDDKGELTRETVTWKQANFSAVMSGCFSCPAQTQREVGKEVPYPSSNPTASR